MAQLGSLNYTANAFPVVLEGHTLSATVRPLLPDQVSFIAQALDFHDHSAGKGLAVKRLNNPVTLTTTPLLATGAGHSVDDVITVLQGLGLCRQV